MTPIEVYLLPRPENFIQVQLLAPLNQGPAGAKVLLRNSTTGIEYKYEGETNWTLLVPLSDITPEINYEYLVPFLQMI